MAQPLQPIATPQQLAAHADALASRIGADHPAGVTLVGVLKGAVVFLTELARRLQVPTRIELLAVAPYDGTTRRTHVVKDLDRTIEGEDVVLVNGIVDTGLTSDFLLRHLRDRDPCSLRMCALADKPARRIIPIELDYVAIEAPDRFLLGYGLDYAGRYRNVPGLWAGDGAALANEPDCYVDALYGRAADRRGDR